MLVPLCTLVGIGYAAGKATTYTAEARVAVGAGSLSTQAIPGFPNAARDLAANYARWINQSGVASLKLPPGVAAFGSPVPDSNVIRIEAKSTDQAAAVKAAGDVATTLIASVTEMQGQNSPAQLMKEIEAKSTELSKADANAKTAQAALNSAIGRGDSTAAISRLGDRYAQAASTYDRLKVQQDARNERYRRLVSQSSTDADLTVVRAAAVSGTDRSGRLQRFGLIGFVLGAVLSLLLATVLDRRRRPVPAQRGSGREVRSRSADTRADAYDPETRSGSGYEARSLGHEDRSASSYADAPDARRTRFGTLRRHADERR